MEGKCTIYFEDPFYVGIFERIDERGYSVARYVFGAEPGDAELVQFVRNDYRRLQFSSPVPCTKDLISNMNFKRRQREARRQAEQTDIGTRAQRALQAEYERQKLSRHEINHAEREEAEQQKFLLKQKQKKQKHRGR